MQVKKKSNIVTEFSNASKETFNANEKLTKIEQAKNEPLLKKGKCMRNRRCLIGGPAGIRSIFVAKIGSKI
ncbi:MAG: hypothetical protein ABIH76_05315 [Candidatus Bathyarchaeota archaeon]